MVAVAALSPFCRFLQHLLNSSQVSLLPPSQQIIKSTLHEIASLNEVLATFEKSEQPSSYFERAKALDRQIREAVWRVEDILQPHLANQYLSQSEEVLASDPNCLPKYIVDLKEVIPELNSFIATVTKIKEEYVHNMELDENRMPSRSHFSVDNLLAEVIRESLPKEKAANDEEIEDSEEDRLSTSSYQMVGLVDEFCELRSLLIKGVQRSQKIYRLAIFGMAGIGKTALAKQLYDDPLISNHFECRAFVSVGQKYQMKQVILDILSQMVSHFDSANRQSESAHKLAEYLQTNLAGKRYLLVLDDVWSEQLCDDSRGFLHYHKGSQILVTTRLASIASRFSHYGFKFQMPFLNDKESWSLFCENVFGKYSWCPLELVKVGQKIVEDCEGLPLAIIAVANLIAKDRENPEYWKKVSEDANPLSIGTNEQQPMLDVLYSSYSHLSEQLKTCFLYMGVFPRRQEIAASKFIRLWIVEGFVLSYSKRRADVYFELLFPASFEYIRDEYLKEIADQSLLLVKKASSRGRIKAFKLHSVYWHICASEARKENLFQIVNKYTKLSFEEDIKGHRRLCIHNNTLFGIKVAYNSMSSISSVYSLLCTGMQHGYPIRMCFEMRLLRVLDVLTIRFYDFPLEVIKLVQLKYLAFTYNGMLHASIHQLWNLEVLIVQPHLSIKTPDAPLYLPVEIWNMKELRYLQVVGAVLPDPSPGAILPKLYSILDINAQSLTTAVIDNIPNLNKLGIQIDSSTQDPFGLVHNLSRLRKLLSLKCVVINPKPKSQFVTPPSPSKIFPPRLRNLTLSGFGYPWKYMREIGELKRLQVLKLRNYAFQGPEWDTYGCNFVELKVLHLEDLDLVHWGPLTLPFRQLTHLIIKHCYRLQNIPLVFGSDMSYLSVIKLVEVKPSVIASSKEICQLRNRYSEWSRVHVDCCCEEGNSSLRGQSTSFS